MLVFNDLKYHLLKKVKPVLQKLHPVFNEYGIFLIIIFTEFFLIRIFEFFYLKNTLNFKFRFVLSEISGVYYDFILIAFLSAICVIPFLIIYRISRKLPRIIFNVLNIIIIIAILMLIEYLNHTFVLLDHVVFAYPIKELLYITRESIDFSFLTLAKYLIAVIIGLIFSNFALKKIKHRKLYIISFLFIFSGVLLIQNLNPTRNKFSNDISFNLTVNKLSYFSKSCVKHILGKSEINAVDFYKKVLEFQEINPEFQFTSQRYPFEHKPDTTDLLGSYFSLNEDPPNLVFIIMESLSRAFCGNDAYLGSFTPFIDSLMQYSLYWENALSTSERTFNAIPSIFGSLPYGEKGFMNQVQPDYTVKHSTLIKWLNDNGYQTNFFYGGWTGFDNMKRFMRYQDTDFILKHFSSEYTKIEADKNGLSWGYPDGSVYQRSFEILDSINQEPRLDVYLTLSLHHPFRTPNKELYNKKFIERMEEIKLTNDQKEEIKGFSGIFSTIIYTDDALKSFFNNYKKRDDYKNTIFIITGDHRINLPYRKNKIDIYHVPLIIFSPMLKEGVKFSSVSSHANITPTLTPFLSKNFNFKMPKKVHWLGKQLDFSRKFRNIHTTPFMKINREITDYLSGEYFLSNCDLYILKDGLRLQQIENPKIIDSITDNLNNFIFLNQYIIKNNLLISDE